FFERHHAVLQPLGPQSEAADRAQIAARVRHELGVPALEHLPRALLHPAVPVGVAPMAADLSGGRVEIARARLADAVALRAGSGPPPHFAGLVTGRAGGAGRAVPERVGPAHLLALLA